LASNPPSKVRTSAANDILLAKFYFRSRYANYGVVSS
jgi:hypothetical protein